MCRLRPFVFLPPLSRSFSKNSREPERGGYTPLMGKGGACARVIKMMMMLVVVIGSEPSLLNDDVVCDDSSPLL